MYVLHGVVHHVWFYVWDVNYVCVHRWGEATWCLSGLAIDSECVQNKDKVEAKDRLKYKYQYFILV